MVRKNGKEGYRSFTLVGASKTSGCRTKGNGGRYINKTPAGAARKAFSDLCRTKRISGICTLYITVRETSRGGRNKGKEYVYKLQRNRLAKPLIRLEGKNNEFVVEYRSTCRSVKSYNKRDCSHSDLSLRQRQTRGRPLKRTAKVARMTPNNVRRVSKRNKRSSNNNMKSPRPLRRSKRLAGRRA